MRLPRLLPLLICTAALLVAAPPAHAVDAGVLHTQIDVQSPTSASRLANGGGWTCVGPNPPTTTTAGARRFEEVYVRHVILDSACLTADVSGPGCSLWTGAYDPFDPGSPVSSLRGRPGTQSGDPPPFTYASTEGHTIVVGVTAADATCDDVTVTLSADRAWATAPAQITGTFEVGAPVTVDDGAWTTPVTVLSRTWYRCMDDQGCGVIPGATGATYVPTVQDAGKRLMARVTVTTAGAAAPSTVPAYQTAPVVLPAPVTGYDVATGSPAPTEPGEVAVPLPGSANDNSEAWKVELPFAFPIDGTEHDEMVVSTEGYLALGSGPSSASHAEPMNACLPGGRLPTGPVVAPFWDDLATTGQPGQGITVSAGADAVTVRWTTARKVALNTPVRFAATLHRDGRIVLRHLEVGAGGGAFAGDEGATIGVQLRAGPAYVLQHGCNEAAAVDGGSVTYTPSRPAVSGVAQAGQTLTRTTASILGPALVREAGWQRCGPDGGGCAPIPGADGVAYLLGPEDVGHTVRAREEATNAFGVAGTESLPTAVVAAAPPSGGGGGGGGGADGGASGVGPGDAGGAGRAGGGSGPDTRDRTAPRIASLTVGPRRPRKGGRATVNVKVGEQAKVTVALVRVTPARRGRKAVRKVLVTRTATTKAGVATVRLPLPRSGALVLEVRATDAAGNASAVRTKRISVRR